MFVSAVAAQSGRGDLELRVRQQVLTEFKAKCALKE